jgi:hypothetical protein
MKSQSVSVPKIQIFQIFKKKFEEEDAEQLVGLFEQSFATKDEFASKEEVFKVDGKVDNSFSRLEGKIDTDIARLEAKIESTSKQTIIWMFAMLVTLLSLAVAAIKLL